MQKKSFLSVSLFAALACVFVMTALLPKEAEGATDFSKVMSRWSKEMTFSESGAIGPLEMKVTFYSSEYVQALIESEAEKNLWTADEKEQFKYSLLRDLDLQEKIPVHVEFNNYGPSMHLAPFDEQITLWVGRRKLTPVDYDKRFNFRLQGKRDGMIFFSRYDDKGKDVLEGVKTVKLSFNGGIHPYVKVAFIDFLWDIHKDDPERLYAGRAASRLELDRLIKRIEKLSAEKRDLEGRISALDAELATINQRVEELQRH